MRFGFALPQYDYSVASETSLRYETIEHYAQQAEAWGFDSLWRSDHLASLADPRRAAPETWATLSLAAEATRRLRFGPLVCPMTFRHPALLAKLAASLDDLSGGRLILGLGAGWNADEHRAFGLPFPSPRERAAQLGEALEVIDRLMREASASFDGTYYRLEDAPSLPRPVQQPRPPIHVGGAGERRTLPVVARYADVWNCPTYALAVLPQKLEVLRRECTTIGRDPTTLGVTEEAVCALVARRADVDAARAAAARRFAGPGWGFTEGGYCGTPEDVIRRIEERVRLGVRGFVFFLHDRGEAETLRLLADEVVPAVRHF